MSADLQSSGKWPSRKDLLTRNEIEGANSNAHDFKITGEGEDLKENRAVRKDSLSSENVEKKRGRKRKATTGESSKNKKS